VHFFMLLEQLINASRLCEISLMGWSKYKEFPGAQVMFPSGYSSLVEKLASSIFNTTSNNSSNTNSTASNNNTDNSHNSNNDNTISTKLLLSTPVASINYEHPEKITISTRNGDVHEFEHVIVTLPLGVLKTSQVQFHPPLLPFKQEAIKNLGFGVLEKIVLRFSNRFWPDGFFGCLPTTDHGNEFFSFVPLHSVVHEPVLLIFIHGHFAKVLQRLDNSKIQELAMNRIREMFPNTAEEPTHCFITKWHDDPYSRGSYSFPHVSGSYRDIENFSEPIQTRFGVPRIMFAGEATDATYFGTTHAAYLSGEREAKRLADHWRNSANEQGENV